METEQQIAEVESSEAGTTQEETTSTQEEEGAEIDYDVLPDADGKA